MVEFKSLALVSAHPPLPAMLNYGISDLTELCSLAAYVRDLVDDVAIPVGPSDRDPLTGFSAYMNRHKPDLVGISTFTCGARSALKYAEIAKRHGAFVVMGGYHPSALPEEMLASPVVDAVVRGEGEETLRDLIVNGPSRRVPGLSIRDGEDFIHNPDRPVIEDLTTLPLPLREVRPKRFGLDGRHYHTDSIYSSRGCKARCVFCANHLVGKKWRRRSNRHVMEELAEIAPARKGKRKHVKLWDANFMTDTDQIAELCEMIIENGFHKEFRFSAETRIEDIIRSREILPLIHEAGFSQLGSGIESPNPETLRSLRKGINLEGVAEASRLLSEEGIHFAKFFIIGHPNENRSQILEYPDFAVSKSVTKESAFFFILTPYPGTRTYEEYHENGMIASYDWDLYTNLGAAIEPNGISRLSLQALLCTVQTQYSLVKRLARGDSFDRLAGKLIMPLLANAKLLQLYGTGSDEELQDYLWEALSQLQDIPPRTVEHKGSRHSDQSLVLRFHNWRGTSVDAVFQHDGDQESFRIGKGFGDEFKRKRIIHLSIPLLYRMMSTFDLRKDPHDIITLKLKPSTMKPAWILSLAGTLIRVSWLIGRLSLFHLRKRFSSLSRHH
ncbi:MAG: radical SAM protein [bacterium]|nr:radical SAM protein [bacterium]